jgi:hypothetical protein
VLASEQDVDASDDLRIRSAKYGGHTGGADKDAQTVMATALRIVKRGERDALYPNFNGDVDHGIGAGAVFGGDEFYVASTHDYYYEVWLGNWTPNIAVMPSFQAMVRAFHAMARALAQADG